MTGEQNENWVHADDYRKRSTNLFQLCEAWIAGQISHEEFLEQRQSPAREGWVLSGVTREQSMQLSQEFHRAVGCAVAVETAIAAMQRDRMSESPTSALRAVYFAKEISSPNDVIALDQCLHEP